LSVWKRKKLLNVGVDLEPIQDLNKISTDINKKIWKAGYISEEN